MVQIISLFFAILLFGFGGCVSEKQKVPVTSLSLKVNNKTNHTVLESKNQPLTFPAKTEKQISQEKVVTLETQLPKTSNEPEQLIGLQSHAVSAILGEPTLKRHDPPAQVWLYTELGCAFHVFLYRRLSGEYTVKYYNFVTPNKKTDPSICYKRLLSESVPKPRRG